MKLHHITTSAVPPPTLTEQETGFNVSKAVNMTTWEQQVRTYLGRSYYAAVELVMNSNKPCVIWQSGGDSCPSNAPGFPGAFSCDEVAVRDPRFTDGTEYNLWYFKNETTNTELQAFLLVDELQAIPFQFSPELRLLGLETVQDNGRSHLVLYPSGMTASSFHYALKYFSICDAEHQKRLLLHTQESRTPNLTFHDRPEAVKEVCNILYSSHLRHSLYCSSCVFN